MSTQELNPGLLHCKQILYHLSHKGANFSFPGDVHNNFPKRTITVEQAEPVWPCGWLPFSLRSSQGMQVLRELTSEEPRPALCSILPRVCLLRSRAWVSYRWTGPAGRVLSWTQARGSRSWTSARPAAPLVSSVRARNRPEVPRPFRSLLLPAFTFISSILSTFYFEVFLWWRWWFSR